MSLEQTLKEHLEFIYPAEIATTTHQSLLKQLARFQQTQAELTHKPALNQLTQADSILITYGDQIQEDGKPTLQTLTEVLQNHLDGVISTVHILPFYPYSSDDGFSVIDYLAVNPDLGDWPDITQLGQSFRLMFDAVINHISAHSHWFQAFLAGDATYQSYFIMVDPTIDLSQVVRPRALPLLTPVETPTGTQHVWTTFSADQIDLNYENPVVLQAIIEALLFYVAQGAELIRLDAIAFMWKEVGTSCLHLPQTHRIIQLFRTVLDIVAPHVILITETNVPHKENISYFGDGRNEAQMVYNFSLAPLTLHTFYTADSKILQKWAATLTLPSEQTHFFNFIASHDGIGVRPAEGILTTAQIQTLADKVLEHGGQVSYKTNADGSQSPYELNSTLFDALSNPKANEPSTLTINRFMASQAIMIALQGVPGIYIHSLFGSPNNLTGLAETGRARTINREKWQRPTLETLLADTNSRAYKIFQRYSQLLKIRATHRAFHPNSSQQIIPTHGGLFTLLRTTLDGSERILCVHNVTTQPQSLELTLADWSLPKNYIETITNQSGQVAGDTLNLTLSPYEVRWLLF